jgi:hypothetical protein
LWQKIKGVENGLLFFVILATSVIMTFGLVSAKEKPKATPELKPETNLDSLKQHS